MKLYYTRTSPYARAVRIAVIEKGLSARVAMIEAKTRTAGSPYYEINPSGRVPFLVLDDGRSMEDSQVICSYLDQIAPNPVLCLPASHQDWAYGRLDAYARSMTDGIAVWGREMRRPEGERSPTILEHERTRALRLADFWEREIAHPLMQGPLNMAQLLLLTGLDFAGHYQMGDHTSGRPKLATWVRRLHERPSIAATAP